MDRTEPSESAPIPGHYALAIAVVGVPPKRGPGSGGDIGAAELSQDFLACQAMEEAHAMAVWGNLERCLTLAEALEFWRGSPYEERHLFLARIGPEPVGLCSVTLPLRENLATAGIDVLVVPGWRRRGVGRALLEHAEAMARTHGRSSLDSFHELPLDAVRTGSQMVPAESGAGQLPLDDPATAFALAAGYRLEQVERSSRLKLPVSGELLDRLESDAFGHAGDYVLTNWDGRCPDSLVAAYAGLRARMSTDAPTAGMDWEREDWDADRVRDDELVLVRGGVQSSVAAALHRRTGDLVAYSVLTWRPLVPESLIQQDTLVGEEHRGHRLGMLVKAANLRRAQEKWPRARSVLTWNASENQHMLAINTALGFRPAGYEGEWQKRLG
ncbi:GNAT family N-acetyltransferase [Arthrobacter sp. SLBN-122]|uniref:GNAT family N-acetyltransferase n=1 Tax=Arthrobacter sp. SLBN-122 TaxID=2768455 RepID=UPI00114EC44D|nr:GNAT family N-acetyltransferase [Arthrobacter sp. SLBN-122]TQJ33353.1 acetyltransferase (GNAT) family protein [Arthrobacter sp. SLBN-122]